jgi:hypothetical protein
LINRVRDVLEKGEVTTQYLSEIKSIPLLTISKVKLLKTALQFHYKDEGIERSARLVMDDRIMSERILYVLVGRLGPDYVLQTKPIRTGLSLTLSAGLVFGATGLTMAGYWAAREVITGGIQSTLMTIIMNLLGINGVIIVGGILIILAFIISIRMFLKPALRTELVKRT